MTIEAGQTYDAYWTERDLARSQSRSLARAALVKTLLRRGNLDPTDGREVSLLDVGCGPGWALEAFVAAGYHARGVDASQVAAGLARQRDLDVRVADWTREDIEGGFDVVTALEVLEHLVDPLAAFRSLARAVKSGGHLVISLPNEFHLLRRLQILLGSVREWGGHDDPHIRHFDRSSAERLFKVAGWYIVERLSDDVIPPRLVWPKRIIGPLLAAIPSLFAISNVYLLGRSESAREEVTR